MKSLYARHLSFDAGCSYQKQWTLVKNNNNHNNINNIFLNWVAISPQTATGAHRGTSCMTTSVTFSMGIGWPVPKNMQYRWKISMFLTQASKVKTCHMTGADARCIEAQQLSICVFLLTLNVFLSAVNKGKVRTQPRTFLNSGFPKTVCNELEKSDFS